jgi:hypothetical protein
MHFLIEISYEPAASDSLQTLVMEAGEKYATFISGKKSSGSRLEGAWMALASGAAYLVIDSGDGIPVYELCHEVTRCAPGIKTRVIPLLPIKALHQNLT